MTTIIRSIAAALVLTLALSGCKYSQYDLAGLVGSYNSSIENLEEQAILTNIVRASDDAPMGFTQLAVVRGSGTLSGQTGLPSLVLGPPGQSVVIGPSGISGASNTNFDLGVLESKEFWTGVLTPLSPDTLAFFIREGVPRSLLFYLYVQRVEIRSPGRPTEVEINNPLDPHFTQFSDDLQTSLNLGLTADNVTRTFNFGPPVPASQAADVTNLLSVAKAGFNIVPVATKGGTAYQLQATQSGSVLCFDQTRATVNILDTLPESATCAAMKGQAPEKTATSFSFAQKATAQRPVAILTIYPRSPYDILRYLGLLLRASQKNGAAYVDLGAGEAQALGGDGPLASKLFVVNKNQPGDDFLSVKYGGDTYSIPKSATTTIEIVTLLRQLIALSTSVNALPQSGTVTTVVP